MTSIESEACEVIGEFEPSHQITCPACGHTGHLDADFEYSEGSERECGSCGRMLVVVEEELYRELRWGALPCDDDVPTSDELKSAVDQAAAATIARERRG